MFEFTTQTVYNSLKVVTADAVKDKTAGKDYNVITSTTKDNPYIRIGNVRFKKGDIISIERKDPTPESLAKVTFDIAKLKTAVESGGTDTFGGSYRIALYLGLAMNSQDSFYANDLVYKGKPFYVEFPVIADNETPAAVAKKIVKIANKYFLFMAQEKVMSVSADGTEVTFEAVNGYQIIRKAVIQKFHEAPCGGCDREGFVDIITGVPVAFTLDKNGQVTPIEGNKKLDENGELVAIDEAVEVPIIPGAEAFGDYAWIIHNLRLPTIANTDYWNIFKAEMPVVGATYKQYIVRMCKERDGIAGEAVGQRVKSVTTHVFYINSAADVTAFESALGQLVDGGIKTSADDVLKDPYHQGTTSSAEPANP